MYITVSKCVRKPRIEAARQPSCLDKYSVKSMLQLNKIYKASLVKEENMQLGDEELASGD
jgi:hypothetical protein